MRNAHETHTSRHHLSNELACNTHTRNCHGSFRKLKLLKVEPLFVCLPALLYLRAARRASCQNTRAGAPVGMENWHQEEAARNR